MTIPPDRKITTLCYIRGEGRILLLYRNKKEHDENDGKWIGVGGKLEPGESPEECLVREVREETGLTLCSWRFRGIITFVSDRYGTEYMLLYEGGRYTGELRTDCEEGELRWVDVTRLFSLPMWEGDRCFLEPMMENPEKMIFLKLVYQGDSLVRKEGGTD